MLPAPKLRPRAKPKPVHASRADELAYARAILAILAADDAKLRAAIDTNVPALAGAVRTDGLGESMGAIFNGLRAAFATGEQAAKNAAADMLARVNKHHAERTSESGLPYAPGLGYERWLADQQSLALTENVRLIQGVRGQRLDDVQGILSRGIQAGTDIADIAREIRQRLHSTTARATLIATDQVLKWNATLTRLRHEDAGITRYTWSTSKDERVRPGHAALEGTEQAWKDPPVVDPRNGKRAHPGMDVRCLPGHAEITFTSPIRRLYRRAHNGKMATIVTESGVTLEATPNHPVLTASGWKAAESVDVGDYVFQVGGNGLFLAEGHVKNRPPTIAEVFDAFALAFPARRQGTVASEFHGDATDDHVDIVDAASDLDGHVSSKLRKRLRELALSMADDDAIVSAGPRSCGFDSSLVGLSNSSGGSVRLHGLLLANFLRSVRESNSVGLRPSPDMDAVALQQISDGLSLGLEPFRDLLYGGSLCVKAQALCIVELGSVMSDLAGSPVSLDATGAEPLAERIGTYSKLYRDGAQRLPALETFGRVIECNIGDFSGHVFNLETTSNWYAATIVVHNCRCVAIPVT